MIAQLFSIKIKELRLMSSINKVLLKNKQKGSTLVEILVAVTIISLVLTAVSAMISMSVKLADSNEKDQHALQKPEEVLEFFRKERVIGSWHGFSGGLDDDAVYYVCSVRESVASMSTQLGTCGDDDVLET